jgi:hypothetical protein
LPSTVKTIEGYAFFLCTNLASIGNNYNNIETIGNWAFSCGSHTSVGGLEPPSMSKLVMTGLPEKLTKLGEASFFGCSKITGERIPDGVTSIPSFTFVRCSSLNIADFNNV